MLTGTTRHHLPTLFHTLTGHLHKVLLKHKAGRSQRAVSIGADRHSPPHLPPHLFTPSQGACTQSCVSVQQGFQNALCQSVLTGVPCTSVVTECVKGYGNPWEMNTVFFLPVTVSGQG